MKLRITVKPRTTLTVVQIDGELLQPGVEELRRACGSIDGPLCLDLANLHSIDAGGIEAVRTLEEGGAAVTGVSPYIQKLLDRHLH